MRNKCSRSKYRGRRRRKGLPWYKTRLRERFIGLMRMADDWLRRRRRLQELGGTPQPRAD
jgi:hypothetical protein